MISADERFSPLYLIAFAPVLFTSSLRLATAPVFVLANLTAITAPVSRIKLLHATSFVVALAEEEHVPYLARATLSFKSYEVLLTVLLEMSKAAKIL